MAATIPPLDPASSAAPLLAFHVDPHDVGYDIRRAREAFAIICDLGGNSLRTDISWFDLQPTPDEWDAEKLGWYQDYFQEAACSFGLAPMAALVGAPPWAVDRLQRRPRGFMEAWRLYCERATDVIGRHISLVQVWNEPNSPILGLFDRRYPGLGRSGRQYFPEIFYIASNILRRHNPAIEIALNVTANLPNWQPFVDFLIGQAVEAFDVIGIDLYPSTYTLTDGRDWQALGRLMQRVNDPGDNWHGKKPAVLELGYSTFVPHFKSEAAQKHWIETALPCVREIHRHWQRQAGLGLRMINWYKLFNDRGEVPLFPLSHFGILRIPGNASRASRKAGYEALRAQFRTFRERA